MTMVITDAREEVKKGKKEKDENEGVRAAQRKLGQEEGEREENQDKERRK